MYYVWIINNILQISKTKLIMRASCYCYNTSVKVGAVSMKPNTVRGPVRGLGRAQQAQKTTTRFDINELNTRNDTQH